MNTELSIVIISWNTRQLLQECLESVFQEPTGLRLEVLVADNHSSDGSAEMVREKFPQVRLIENRENLGFAIANNRLFPLCSSDLLLLLNSDTVVKDDALRVLCDFMRAHPAAGAIGPRLLHPITRLRTLGCGRSITLRTTFNHYSFLSLIFPRIRAFEGFHYFVGVHDDKVREVDWISGACLLVRRPVIEQVGPLSEKWFMYAEDHEWCVRMSKAGWKLYQEPKAVVDHYQGASTRKNPAASLMPFTATRELFIELNAPSPFKLWIFDVIRTLGLRLRSLVYLLYGFKDRTRQSLWRAKAGEFLVYARACTPASARAMRHVPTRPQSPPGASR